MTSWVRTRRNKTGLSFQVLWRRGGREYAIEYAGTFKTQREAKIRRDMVAGWLAQGLDPRAELAKLQAPPAPRLTYRQVAARYQDSRIDHTDGSRKNTETHLKRLLPMFGDKVPDEITVADNIAAVAALTEELAASSVSRYWITHRLILDFAGVTPNPARDRAVKLPTVRFAEVIPPTAAHVLAILDVVPAKYRLPLIVIEQTAMTVAEIGTLEWGDVDTAEARFRLRRAAVKRQIRARARWIQLPEWLMPHIEALCPFEDRVPGRRVFRDLGERTLWSVMTRACPVAGVPHYHPHDLRHRRISLWHGQGVPARELAARAGHSHASMSLDVYSHVMPLDECGREALEALLVMPR